ncbi:MAG: aminomethyl-transferring glycine dehydrogenase subunit GcvPA [Acidimicrobiaceae bacterium]|nr:aminomethyl-transferring glycine dehydrogenase subunit GcvPA [Acidimicrobiaceae bacterium]
MSGFIPHTTREVEEMLSFLGLSSIEDLFNSIPASIRLAKGDLNLPNGASEPDVLNAIEGFANSNRPVTNNLVCFAGGGAYDHDISSATKALASRSEFVTAYTPYQPEVAQGVLQALFEYQTLVSRLSGLPIANASLYDGASALVEAINLCAAQNKNHVIWMSQGINPSFRTVVDTFAAGTGHEIIQVPLKKGLTDWTSTTGGPPGTMIIGYPNYLGIVEDLNPTIHFAVANDIRVIIVYDPLAMALLKSPGAVGADVAVAEGQAFGTGLNFGGPYVGLFSTKNEYVRLLPGRLVGETVDANGQKGYVTTLRTREQDIRREKASSNVCTNQTLIAITAAIQLSWLGKSGIKELARRCYAGTEYLKKQLKESGHAYSQFTDAPTVREFAIRTPIAVETVVERMLEEGYLAGIPLRSGFEDSDVDGSLLVSVTEKRTAKEIEEFVNALQRVAK